MPDKTSSVIQAVLFISAIFLLVAAFVVGYVLYFNRRKIRFIREKEAMQKEYDHQLLHARVEVQEATFQHIGRELHDNLGQLLSSTKMLLNMAEMNMTVVPESFATASSTLSLAIKEMRLLARTLDKEWLQQFDFSENLHNQIERINAAGHLKASYQCDTYIDMRPGDQVILFRIVQEAIQNAIRHGQPTCIDIIICQKDHQLQLAVIDNGKGIPADFHGMGTNNMRQRVQLFKGSIDWSANQPTGTVVTIMIPQQLPIAPPVN